jgi:RNA polymerase sigma-54 factor
MSVSQSLQLKQGQSLVMTPQLQQAIKLLQLSNLELAAYVDQEIEQNPLLDRGDGAREDAPAEAAGKEEAPQQQENWEQGPEQFAEWGKSGGSFNGDDALSLENVLTKETTLREHLVAQLNEEIEDPTEHLIGLFLIDQLDEAGYLKEDSAAVATLLGSTLEQVEAVRQKFLRFDPVGIGARNLSECLAAQLREKDRLDPAMQKLLANLELLGARDYKQLLKICEVDAEDLKDMIAEVQELNPRPSTGFGTGPSVTVLPDVLMRPSPQGGWVVELNPATLPRVLVNEQYYARVSSEAKVKIDKDYLAERFAQANWLVKALHQRAQTILKVSTEIVRRQHEFFVKGIHHLKPLILRDIAEVIEMHESTVSRVTAGKFIATPRGLFELKYFFTTAVGGGATGEDSHSAEAVRHRLKELIAAEDPKAILSDDTLVELLKKDGIDIARRTVAKYREAMNIGSSVQRRREKSGLL